MTRKHFEALARDFRAAVADSKEAESGAEVQHRLSALYIAASNVATTCAIANVRFDRAKFLQACGF